MKQSLFKILAFAGLGFAIYIVYTVLLSQSWSFARGFLIVTVLFLSFYFYGDSKRESPY